MKELPHIRLEDLPGPPPPPRPKFLREATFETPDTVAQVHYSMDTDGTVLLWIGPAEFDTAHIFRKQDLAAFKALLTVLEGKLK